MTESKVCTQCGRDLPRAAFTMKARMRDGLDSWCRLCRKAYNAERYQRVKKHHNKLTSAWRKANPEKAKLIDKKHKATDDYKAQRRAYRSTPEVRAKESNQHAMWVAVNRDRSRELQRTWYAANSHVAIAAAIRRRSVLRNAVVAWAEMEKIAEVYAFAAEFRSAGVDVEVDHIVPLQGRFVSGLHVHQNLRVVLKSVNRSKSNKFDEATHLA